MSQLNRLLALAGLSPKQALIKELEASKKGLNEAHERAIKQVSDDKQLDEGLFSSLKAALATVKDIGSAPVGKAIAATVKKLAEPIRQMYLDNKAKEELKAMYKSFQKIVNEFERVEEASPTMLSRDPEVKKEIELFKDLMVRTLRSLRARAAVAMAEGKDIYGDDADLLAEEFLGEGPASPDGDKQASTIGDSKPDLKKVDAKQKEKPKKGQTAMMDDDEEGEIEDTNDDVTTVKLKNGTKKQVKTSTIKATIDKENKTAE